MPTPDILGLPWPDAKRLLEAAGTSYTVKETLAPGSSPDWQRSPGIVVRVLENAPTLEVTIAYPVINPIQRTSSE
ncbi:MAG: hypothetical protein H0Z38_03955 [Firmicutes bacterium]|nr:hypothetical protein [Bacillota bacterium]